MCDLGVTGNGILEEAEGMEAFLESGLEGECDYLPRRRVSVAFAQRGGAGGKSLCSPWMEAVDSVLQCGRFGRGSWNRTGEAGGRGCENGSDVGNRKPVLLCGFSAGGHVAASLGVLWNEPEIFSKDQAESIRPDGLIAGIPGDFCRGMGPQREAFEMLGRR